MCLIERKLFKTKGGFVQSCANLVDLHSSFFEGDRGYVVIAGMLKNIN